MAQVVAGFPGVGKSTLTKEDPSIGDSDSSQFDKEYFPGNYMAHVRNRMVADKLTLVSSHDIVRQALVKSKIDYILVYPALECKDEYLKRYAKRGSELKFIDLLERNWDDWIKDCQAQEGCTHVVLQPGQFLADVIEIRDGEFAIKGTGPDDLEEVNIADVLKKDGDASDGPMEAVDSPLGDYLDKQAGR